MEALAKKVTELKTDKALCRQYKVNLYWGFYAWHIAMAGIFAITLLSITLFKKTQTEWIVNTATLICWPLLAWAMISVFKPKTTILKEQLFYLRAFKDLGGIETMPDEFKALYSLVKTQKKILFLQWNKIIEDEVLKKALIVVLLAKIAMHLELITLPIVITIGIIALGFFSVRLWLRHTQTGYVNTDVFTIYTLSQLLTLKNNI